jgi:transcriptional regulator with XRE-family HTH domain
LSERNFDKFERNLDKMSIGAKVRYYRNLKHLSQRDLADMVGVSQSIISSLESDKNIPNTIMLHEIAKELDVDINEFLKERNIIQNNYGKSIGNINSKVTINNNFSEDIINTLLANQEKITNLFEIQNKLIKAILEK